MSVPDKCQMALKEWAITCEAIGRGEQILLLRKGGIHEDGKDFRVIHREFLLYPTYEHQKADLLRTEHQPALEALLERPHGTRQANHLHPLRQGGGGAGSGRTAARWTTWRRTTSGPPATPSRGCAGSRCCPCR